MSARRQRGWLLVAAVGLGGGWTVGQDDPYDRESVRNGYFHTSTYGAVGGGSEYTLSVNP